MRYTGLLVCAFHASGAELNLLPRKSSHFKAKERNHEANAPKVIDRDTGAPEQNITGDFHQCLTDKLDLDLDVDLVTVPSGNDKMSRASAVRAVWAGAAGGMGSSACAGALAPGGVASVSALEPAKPSAFHSPHVSSSGCALKHKAAQRWLSGVCTS